MLVGPVCKSTSNLRKCLGCNVVSYCGRDHQVSHRKEHSQSCKNVKKLQTAVDQEEQFLRSFLGDALHPDDDEGPAGSLFEEAHGSFFEVAETQGYMTLRYALVQSLLEFKTVEAVTAAYLHCDGLLRFHPPDGLGVEDLIAPLAIRLGLVQTCYDRLRWSAVDCSDPTYDWGDLPAYPDIVQGQDFLEPVDAFLVPYVSLSQKVALTLIKITVLLDIKSLQNAAFLGERLPPEIVSQICRSLVTCSVRSRKDIMESQYQGSIIHKLELQIKALYDAVHKESPQLWSERVKPRAYMPTIPDLDGSNSKNTEVVIRFNYDAWEETPGACQFIKELAQRGAP